MKKIRVPKLGFAHFAIIFAVVGIIVLYFISTLSVPPEIQLDEVGGYVGEDVIVKGIVIDYELTVRNDAKLIIYGDNTTLKVKLEDCHKQIDINDRIKLQGEVREFRGQYELVAVTDNSVEILDYYNVELVPLNELANYVNQYIAVEGVVVDQSIYGNGELYLELFQNNVIISAYIEKYDEFVEKTSQELNITDTLRICGIVQSASSGHKMIVMNEDSVEITGSWDLRQISIENLTLHTQLRSQQIAKELAKSPMEYSSFPVNIKGYVKYEPQYSTSFYIAEKPCDGSYSLKVRAVNCAVPQLHKGDKVNLTGNLVYELRSLRYSLEALSIEVLERYGNWQVELPDLVTNSFEYLNATVNISGYVYRLWDEQFFYLVDNNQSYNFSLRVYVYDFNVSMPEHDEYVEVTAEFIYYERFLCYELLVRNPWELRRVEH